MGHPPPYPKGLVEQFHFTALWNYGKALISTGRLFHQAGARQKKTRPWSRLMDVLRAEKKWKTILKESTLVSNLSLWRSPGLLLQPFEQLQESVQKCSPSWSCHPFQSAHVAECKDALEGSIPACSILGCCQSHLVVPIWPLLVRL